MHEGLIEEIGAWTWQITWRLHIVDELGMRRMFILSERKGRVSMRRCISINAQTIFLNFLSMQRSWLTIVAVVGWNESYRC